jgi:hypothetical protein
MMSSLLGIEAPPCNHSCGAEKDEAREIQNSLLPSGTLRNAFIEIAYRFSPFGEVGGDFAVALTDSSCLKISSALKRFECSVRPLSHFEWQKRERDLARRCEAKK